LHGLIFDDTGLLLDILVLKGRKILRNYGVVVLSSMVADSYGLNIVSYAVIVVFLLFVESAHWLARVGIDLDGSTINFGESFDFNVVAPDFVLSLAIAVNL